MIWPKDNTIVMPEQYPGNTGANMRVSDRGSRLIVLLFGKLLRSQYDKKAPIFWRTLLQVLELVTKF